MKMKQIMLRVAIGLLTFLIGVSATAIWLNKLRPNASRIPVTHGEIGMHAPSASQAMADETMHSMKLCELVQQSAHFEAKVVRLDAFYNQGVDTASLDDSGCDAWLRPSCAASDEECERIWNGIMNAERSGNASAVRVDVIGRYRSHVVDPNPLQGGRHVHLFEILELNGAKPYIRRMSR